MTARKLSKRELANLRRSKAARAKRDKREPLTPMDVWAIEVHEAYQALTRQGFSPEQAMDYITSTFHRPAMPDWSIENPDHSPLEDEDEDD